MANCQRKCWIREKQIKTNGKNELVDEIIHLSYLFIAEKLLSIPDLSLLNFKLNNVARLVLSIKLL